MGQNGLVKLRDRTQNFLKETKLRKGSADH